MGVGLGHTQKIGFGSHLVTEIPIGNVGRKSMIYYDTWGTCGTYSTLNICLCDKLMKTAKRGVLKGAESEKDDYFDVRSNGHLILPTYTNFFRKSFFSA